MKVTTKSTEISDVFILNNVGPAFGSTMCGAMYLADLSEKMRNAPYQLRHGPLGFSLDAQGFWIGAPMSAIEYLPMNGELLWALYVIDQAISRE
jgi:hypothetical protein